MSNHLKETPEELEAMLAAAEPSALAALPTRVLHMIRGKLDPASEWVGKISTVLEQRSYLHQPALGVNRKDRRRAARSKSRG